MPRRYARMAWMRDMFGGPETEGGTPAIEVGKGASEQIDMRRLGATRKDDLWSSKSNGDANRLQDHDRPVHDWYRFVLSFPPHLVRSYLRAFDLGPGHRVLDPFCGTGTTLVECKKLGIESVGIEANPMAHFASLVKTDWSPDPDGLVRHAHRVAAAAIGELANDNIEVLTIDLFRVRLATATREQLREEVLVLRWPGENN